MRRKLFTLAAAVSTVLCVGVCVLWVRSGPLKKMERVRRGSSHREVEVRSTGGKLYFDWITAARASPDGPQPWHYRRFDGVVDMPPLGAPSHVYLERVMHFQASSPVEPA